MNDEYSYLNDASPASHLIHDVSLNLYPGSRTHSASIPDPKDSRPLPDVFEFIDYRTSTFPMTYRCSVAVISVGGVAVPPDKYRFHTCVSPFL